MKLRRITAITLIWTMLLIQMVVPRIAWAADMTKVVTLGADLTEQQKKDILSFFGVSEGSVQIAYVTNAEERALLSGKFSDADIGTKTFSCAYIHITTEGGIHTEIGNLTKVTSPDIAMAMSLSGFYNGEVVTAAPFEVSGTGALTGVMKAYEYLTNQQLDPEKKEVAVKTIETKTQIADSVGGKDQATIVINDIAISVIRDGVTEQEAVVDTVNTVLETADGFLRATGSGFTSSLTQPQKDRLYDLGSSIANIHYNYDDLKPTLQRVTRTVSERNGFNDPIIETFDSSDLVGLPEDSIISGMNEDAMGDIIIDSTVWDMPSYGAEGKEVSLTTDSIILTPKGTATSKKVRKATSTKKLVPDNAFSVEKDGTKTLIKDSTGNVVFESDEPYAIEDVKAGKVRFSYDEERDKEIKEKEKKAEEKSTGLHIIEKISFGRTLKYGLISLDESISLGPQLDWIFETKNHPIPKGSKVDIQNGYGDFGYIPVVYEGQFGFVTEAGEVTCMTDVAVTVDSIFKQPSAENLDNMFFGEDGCSTFLKIKGGSNYLVSGDNVITDLGTAEISPLLFGGGALWSYGSHMIIEMSSQDYRALIDWHGNILLEGFYDYALSRDGRTLYARDSAGYRKYHVDYVGNLAQPSGSGSQSAQTADTAGTVQAEQSTPEEGAQAAADTDSQSQLSAAPQTPVELLTAVSEALESDMEGNRNTALQYLRQAKALVDMENTDAGLTVNSVITLLESGATDFNTVNTLIDTAISLID